jgi:hypothetical protein
MEFETTLINGDLIWQQIQMILGIGFIIALMVLPLSIKLIFRAVKALGNSLVRM